MPALRTLLVSFPGGNGQLHTEWGGIGVNCAVLYKSGYETRHCWEFYTLSPTAPLPTPLRQCQLGRATVDLADLIGHPVGTQFKLHAITGKRMMRAEPVERTEDLADAIATGQCLCPVSCWAAGLPDQSHTGTARKLTVFQLTTNCIKSPGGILEQLILF